MTSPIEVSYSASEYPQTSGQTSAPTVLPSSTVAAPGSESTQTSIPSTTAPSVTSSGAQVWHLTFDSGGISTDDPGAQYWYTFDPGTATVVVQPFSYSGEFEGTSNSAGWWISAPDGNTYQLTTGGNVFHNSPDDTWEFVTFGTVSGSSAQCLGTATGTANGNFPNANTVQGTYTLHCSETDSLGGEVTWTLSGTWSGERG